MTNAKKNVGGKTPTTLQSFQGILNEVIGEDNSSLLKILWEMISPPKELVGLHQIAENISEIMDHLPEIRPERWDADLILDLQVLCESIVAHKKDFCHFKKYTASGTGKVGPFFNYVVSNPLYTAVWHTLSDEDLHCSYTLLQAQMVNGMDLIASLPDDQVAGLASSIKKMSLVVRRLPYMDNSIDTDTLIRLLPRESCLDVDYAHQISIIAQSEKNSSLSDPLGDLDRFFAFALRERNPHHRNSVNKQEITPEKTPGYRKDQLETLCQSEISREEADVAYAHGCARGEQYGSAEWAFDKRPLNEDRGEALEFRVMQTLGKYKHIASLNQHLPHSWERLNQQDVGSLLLSCDQLANQIFKSQTIPMEWQGKLGALLTIIFWTASPLSRVLETRVVFNADSLPEMLEEDLLYLIAGDEPAWAIAPLDIPDQKMPKKEEISYFTSQSSRLQIPFLSTPGAWACVEDVATTRATLPGQRLKRLFPKSSWQQLCQLLGKAISVINRRYRTRLTVNRISNYLFFAVAEVSGDMADASLCFSRLPPTGQETPLYYHAPQVGDLAVHYHNAVHRINTAINSSFQLTELRFNVENRTPGAEGSLGSRICPVQETVVGMVRDQLARLQYRKKNYIADNAFRQWHNDFTAYCVMMLGFATGYRAVRDPLSSTYDIDWSTGFVVISDKDDNHYYHARLTWLPPVCLEQLQVYEEYRLTIPVHVWPSSPVLAEQAATSLPFFFLISKDYESELVRPTSLLSKIDWSYTLPVNINRHYLRTNLRKLGVSAEIVNAFMGHWGRGQEPFGRYSSLTPVALKDILSTPLTKLMQEAGWQVVKGVGQ